MPVEVDNCPITYNQQQSFTKRSIRIICFEALGFMPVQIALQIYFLLILLLLDGGSRVYTIEKDFFYNRIGKFDLSHLISNDMITV